MATKGSKEILDEEILALDATIASAAERIDLSALNPINAEQVKKGVKDARDTNLAFQYPPAPSFGELRKGLKALSFPQTDEGTLLRKKREYLLVKAAMVESVGTAKFAAASKRLHPLPSPRLVRQAEEILERTPAEKSDNVRLQDAYRDLQKTFERLGLPWKVQKMNMVASASVMPSQRALYLKRKELFSRRFIERLKIHEIGTHAIRAENGRLQPLKVFILGLAGYLPTEEGLAVYNEEKFGLLDNTVLRNYAGRVVAVATAAKGTFTDVVERLQPHFPEKKAMTLAVRAKRGLASGAEKGGYTKDSVYLEGYTTLKAYEAQGGDFTPLYYGKVGLDDLEMLERFEWLVKPKYFPEMIMKPVKR